MARFSLERPSTKKCWLSGTGAVEPQSAKRSSAGTRVRCQMEPIMFAAIDIGYSGALPAREHTDIVEAIRRRDPRAARQAMHNHIVGSKEKVMLLAAGSPARAN